MAEELSKTLKEGERILAPTRRPDGTLRKPVRIRAGYIPQEEVAIYQPKAALMRKEMEQMLPPGYDPVPDVKPKTKSAKRNEKKKEKRLQATLEKGTNLETDAAATTIKDEGTKSVESLTSQINELAVSINPAPPTHPSAATEDLDQGTPAQDVDKKIRALKKKIRLAEAQLQKTSAHDLKQEQLEKFSKLEGWRQELKLLEDKLTPL